VSLLRQSIASLVPWRSRFDPRPVHVGFLVGKVALVQVIPQYFGFLVSVSLHQCSVHHFVTTFYHKVKRANPVELPK